MVLCSNPKAQYLAHKAEIDSAIANVLDSGWYILGKEVESFEREFAAYIGVAYGVGVGNGTEAIHLALVACGVGSGDEVITVSHTAVATVSAILSAGATPIMIDIEPDFYTMDPGKIQAAITSRTKAIIVVHLYGQPADLDPILEIAEKHGLRVLEDCAQAHGAVYRDKRVGSYGDISCFSFYPTKNLGALGDGGMVVTDSRQLADKAVLLRQYGWSERYVSHTEGWNTRLDELQAAVLRVKLKHLDENNAKRIALAKIYDEAFKALPVTSPKQRANSTHVYHLYVLRSARRDALLAHLRGWDIGAAVHYPVPVHMQPAYSSSHSTRLGETEKAAKEIISLPMYPELSKADLDTITEAIREFAVR